MKYLHSTIHKHVVFALTALLLTSLVFVSSASAAIPAITNTGNLLNLDLKVLVAGKPIYCILVEKDFQRLRVLEHDGRLKVVAEYFAVTGENFGRKQIEGDEKTPEGVYFITKAYVDNKITVFGNRAFHLNYPNIYDQSDGRSGNGIYIHGTNKELRSNSTNGCITLNNTDLEDLSQYLSVGSIPIIVVSSLDNEAGNTGLYPNLTKDNFALAKKLLIVGSNKEDLDFVSLYLIRAAGQTVVAGEYKADTVASQSLYSAAYLDISQEQGWFVAERGPGSQTLQTVSEEVVSTVEDMVSRQDKPSVLAQQTWSALWEPKNEVTYLNWYRDSLAHEQAAIHPVVEENPAANAPTTEQGSTPGTIYGFIILAVCIGIGSVLVLKRSQPQRAGVHTDPETALKIEQMRAEKLASEQLMTTIQKELDRTKGSLRLVQEQMQEEKNSMEKDLEVKINALESQLSEAQAEVDQLTAEKAALKLKGMAHLSGQVEELGSLKVELAETQEKLEEARKESARLPVLESMINAQKDETNRLAAENAARKASEAEADSKHSAELQTLKDQIAFLELQLREEIDQKDLSTSKLAEFADLEHDLVSAKNETKQVQNELYELQKQLQTNPPEELEQEIARLRGRVSIYKAELSSESEKRESLSAELHAAQLTEQELLARTATLEQLENENSRLKEELAANDVEEELAALRERLSSYEKTMSTKNEENSKLAAQLNAVQASHEAQAAETAEIIKRLEADSTQLKEELAASRHDDELAALAGQVDSFEAAMASKEEENAELTARLNAAHAAHETMAAEKAEIIRRLEADSTQLKEELAASRHDDELAALHRRIDSYESAVASKDEENAELAAQLSAAKAAQAELSADKTSAIQHLQSKINHLKEELDANDHQEELTELRNQLATERNRKDELIAQLAIFSRLEEDLAANNEALQRLEAENIALLAAADRSAEQEELKTLQSQLAELTAALENERANSAHFENRSKRLTELEDCVVARQVEVTNLTNELTALQAKALSSSEQIINLQNQVDTLQNSLDEERAQRLELKTVVIPEAHAVVPEPEQFSAAEQQVQEPIDTTEVALETVTDKVTPEPEPQPEPAATTPASTDDLKYGTQFLPEDILKKWIGQS